jgi:hypothetical protein
MEVGYPKSHHDILFLLDRSLVLRHALEQLFFNILKKHTCIANIFFLIFHLKPYGGCYYPFLTPQKNQEKKKKKIKKYKRIHMKKA